MKVFSVLNNFVRLQINGSWDDVKDTANILAIASGKHAGKLPDINSVDICLEGHISHSDFMSTKTGQSGCISGKALLAHSIKVVEARSDTTKKPVRPLVVDETASYTVLAKRINGKAVTVRHATTTDNKQLSYITVRIASEQAEAVEIKNEDF